jgi:hypothetical protein
MKRRKNLSPPAQRAGTPAVPEGALPATLFKSSLRLWQARWKAQQADGSAEPVSPTAAQAGPGRGEASLPG